MNTIITRTEAKLQQGSHYFTGKACKHGHICMRRTKDGKCMDCDKMRGEQFREARPDVMKKWREQNPGYASEKYHEQKDDRHQQTLAYYAANREVLLAKRKEWYYDPMNQERIKEGRRAWYAANPDYDSKYRARNTMRLLTVWAPAYRKRFYQKRKAKLHQIFTECAKTYALPTNPSEHDLKYWLAGKIANRTGLEVYKEVFIDSTRTSRIDLLIPSQKIGIELKLSNTYGNTNLAIAQQARYQQILPDYKIYLVSLDGSIGVPVLQLLEELGVSI